MKYRSERETYLPQQTPGLTCLSSNSTYWSAPLNSGFYLAWKQCSRIYEIGWNNVMEMLLLRRVGRLWLFFYFFPFWGVDKVWRERGIEQFLNIGFSVQWCIILCAFISTLFLKLFLENDGWEMNWVRENYFCWFIFSWNYYFMNTQKLWKRNIQA